MLGACSPPRLARLLSPLLALLLVAGMGPAPPPAVAAPAPPAERSAMRVGGTGGKGARLHEAPGLGAAILMVIPEGEAVVVTGASQSGDGYDWAPVEYGAATRWVATVLLIRGDAGGS